MNADATFEIPETLCISPMLLMFPLLRPTSGSTHETSIRRSFSPDAAR